MVFTTISSAAIALTVGLAAADQTDQQSKSRSGQQQAAKQSQAMCWPEDKRGAQRAELRQMFQRLDADNNGEVTLEEMQECLKKANIEIKNPEERFTKADQDNDDILMEREFVMIAPARTAQADTEDRQGQMQRQGQSQDRTQDQTRERRTGDRETEIDVEQKSPRVQVDREAPDVQVQQRQAQVQVDEKEPKVVVDQKDPTVTVRPQAPDVDVQQRSPEVEVDQPAPDVKVKQARPDVDVQTAEPKVKVDQAQPDVTVQQAKPNVEVDAAKPQVQVTQADPDVKVKQAKPDVDVEQAGQDQRERTLMAQTDRDRDRDQMDRQQRDREQQQTEQRADRQQAEQERQRTRQAQTGRQQDGETRVIRLAESDQDWAPDDLVGESLFSMSTEDEIGDIEEIVADPEDDSVFAVVGMGGVLGFGEKKVLIPVSELAMRDGVLMTQMTENQLKQRDTYRQGRYERLARGE